MLAVTSVPGHSISRVGASPCPRHWIIKVCCNCYAYAVILSWHPDHPRTMDLAGCNKSLTTYPCPHRCKLRHKFQNFVPTALQTSLSNLLESCNVCVCACVVCQTCQIFQNSTRCNRATAGFHHPWVLNASRHLLWLAETGKSGNHAFIGGSAMNNILRFI